MKYLAVGAVLFNWQTKADIINKFLMGERESEWKKKLRESRAQLILANSSRTLVMSQHRVSDSNGNHKAINGILNGAFHKESIETSFTLT